MQPMASFLPGKFAVLALTLLTLSQFGLVASRHNNNGAFSFDFGFQQPQQQQTQFQPRKMCPPGQIMVSKPEGLVCMRDMKYLWMGQQDLSVVIPDASEAFTPEEEQCFNQRKIFWPQDGECYALLQQGPCGNGEWLVATEASKWGKREISVSCKKRKCPCLAHDPDFCEVQIRETWPNPNCRNCVTALAAEQDGICGQGEQLLTTPFGFGICGCRLKPKLHVAVEGTCYPLHEQGPCRDNETLHWDPKSNEPACVPTVCPNGYVLAIEDGRCHVINTQGPCEHPGDVYEIDEVSKQVKCHPRNHHQVKRIFDVLPSNLRRAEGQVGFEANMLMCGSLTSGGGKCISGGSGRNQLSTIADPRMGKRYGKRYYSNISQSGQSQEKALEFVQWIREFLN